MSDAWMFPNVPALGGGAWFNTGASGLANAYAQQAQNAGYFGDQAAAMHASQVPQAQLYGGGFFGAQPAAYAGLGAAYGRGTGGFGGYSTGAVPDLYTAPPAGGGEGGEAPPTPVDVNPSIFDTAGTGPVPYMGGAGSPFGGGGFSGYGGRDAIAQSMMPPAIDFSGGMAPFDPNSFANRFAAGGYYQPGTPSQYYTGDQYPGAMAPPSGYETLFGPDNPRGALPVGGFRGLLQPGVMGAGGDGGEDTLTAQDADIPYGLPGSFDPSAFTPGQFAPGSPFGSGRGVGGRPGGIGGLGFGTGTMMPPTAPPFSGAEGSGFSAPGSTQRGGLYAGSGMYPALIGPGQDQYGNPFIHGSAPPYGLETGRMGGGYGIGGLGQGTAFRPVGIR